jgi:MinD-like ATPase involved in chromosome partitioning or flagellar assembly
VSRVRDVVRIPYDPYLAAGSIVDWSRLSPYTREAARELAALVVEGVAEDSSVR